LGIKREYLSFLEKEKDYLALSLTPKTSVFDYNSSPGSHSTKWI